MREIKPSPIPQAINYSEIQEELQELLNTQTAKRKVYRGDILDENSPVYNLRQKYLHKCGYCERYCSRPQVEHHRPKGSVSTDNGLENGYYWLAYEWTNLVASCSDCNERPYKGSRFPINDIRKTIVPTTGTDVELENFHYSSDYLSSENPLLIHPEFTKNISSHFYFTTEGEIIHLSQLGETSIDVYGLSRDDLNLWRKKVYKAQFNKFNKIVRDLLRYGLNDDVQSDFEDFIKDLAIEAKDENLEYTLYNKYMFDHIDDFFVNTQQDDIQNLLNEIILGILEDL